MNLDGYDVRRLSNGSRWGSESTWSPDGTRIALSRDRDIYVIGADGGNLQQLTGDQGHDFGPVWPLSRK